MAYLSSGISTHLATQVEITDEGETMFATDSFMNAEVTYREGRVRREWSGRRFKTASRRSKDADAR